MALTATACTSGQPTGGQGGGSATPAAAAGGPLVASGKDTYSRGLADFSAKQMVQTGIVANGVVGDHPDTTLGNFDMARVKRTIDIVTPIFAAEKKPVRPGLNPTDIATNEFIDPRIGLPA